MYSTVIMIRNTVCILKVAKRVHLKCSQHKKEIVIM